MTSNSKVTFEEVFAKELDDVVTRRKNQELPTDDVLADDEENVSDPPSAEPRSNRGLIGLSLSGGGIRSAAFCLGVLQALEAKWDLMKRVDYLSTVSGGGYLGSSVAVGMSKSKGQFPFPSELGGEEDERVGHLRDYSNYLIAGKLRNVLEGIGAIFMGLMANILLVLPLLMIAAGVTILFNPTKKALSEPWQEIEFLNIFGLTGNFVITTYVFLFAVAVAIGYILYWAAFTKENAQSRGRRRRRAARILLVPLIVGFVELQPVAINWYWDISLSGNGAFSWLRENLGTALAGISAALAAGGSWMSKLVKSGEEGSGWNALLSLVTGRLLYIATGLVVPLFLWVVYLNLSKWGMTGAFDYYSGAPSWVNSWFLTFGNWVGPNYSSVVSYLLLGSILLVVSFLLPPNSFTLYFLYRDRLAKGFVGAHSKQNNDRQKFTLSELKAEHCPTVLVNAALNILGDKKLNQRRRHADFFTFSRRHCGTDSTGYCKTKDLEFCDGNFDIATAMAISGAAASANMGSKTKRLLVFSLAILNIRLGYWLPNPGRVQQGKSSDFRIGKVKIPNGFLWFYREVRGALRANSSKVYLSDGGHIENLGIYELIRRKCKVIIAVDGEADPSMTMSSFIKLQQYIRIDMGVRIDMDWDKIRKATLGFKPDNGSGNDAEKEPDANPEPAPHCAIGLIHYSGEGVSEEERETGILIYVKSSVTGDENDYIRDYKRRNPAFPHQSTGDQFFSEEQFEVYRALGFHAAGGLFNGKGAVQGVQAAEDDTFRNLVKDSLKSGLNINSDINWV